MGHIQQERQEMMIGVVGARKVFAAGLLALLAGCTVVPKSQAPAPPPVAEPTPDTLPTDTARHRIALLVPMTGENGAAGQSIANAATMALLDTNAENLRITTYDTGRNAGEAARRALADGNALILGPLLSNDIPAVVQVARPAGVPLISFSNDSQAAARDVFILGNLPGQSIARSVAHARQSGVARFAALVPQGDYGQRTAAAFNQAVQEQRGVVAGIETYDRSNTSVASAAARLRERGGFGAVLIADSGRIASRAAPLLMQADGDAAVRILGTELWSGDKAVSDNPALHGAWFATVSDARFGQFSESYRRRFGTQPFRIGTLGYDAVLLTLRVARDWKPGRPFPLRQMLDKGGFLGLDGAFRFSGGGVIERALEVREVRANGTGVVSPAPARFND